MGNKGCRVGWDQVGSVLHGGGLDPCLRGGPLVALSTLDGRRLRCRFFSTAKAERRLKLRDFRLLCAPHGARSAVGARVSRPMLFVVVICFLHLFFASPSAQTLAPPPRAGLLGRVVEG